MKLLSAIALLGTLAFSAPAQAHEGWYGDFDTAAAVAKEQKKDLLVDFTGSDWCGWCIKLNEEVFDHDVFRKGIDANYVLVALDFPHKEPALAAVPNPERNDELKDKYGIRGFPTILLMTADGVVYGKTGYQKGGPKAYLEHVAELRKTGRKELDLVLAAVKGYKEANADTKTAAVGKILDTLEGLSKGSAFADQLIEPAMSALELDPQNESGLKLRAIRVLSKASIHRANLLAGARELDSDNAKGVLEVATQAQFNAVTDGPSAKVAMASLDTLNTLAFQDKEIGFTLNFTAANWAGGPLDDKVLAKSYALKAKAIGHKDEEMVATLEQYLGNDEEEVVEEEEEEIKGEGN